MAVESKEHAAAVAIQKRYRGYRARRKLADAAIMAKSFGWWNLVDSVVLQEYTQLYYAHSESWRASDNWKRLNRKAAKVGKGLSKDNKALKLALQHWLEAVDARHRYGHNLRPYYVHWLQLDTHQPFFYSLDVGDGRFVELPKCSRVTLSQQMINYLSPEQRKHYQVEIYNGKLFYEQTGELVHTGNSDNLDERWIFVMSPYGRLYVGKKQRGVFQHSSFLAGGATIAAGRLCIHKGVLQLMEAHSGHYRPSPENFELLIRMLIERGADLSLAKVHLVSDDLSEKKQGKKLAGEVREAMEEVTKDEHVPVKVGNQNLVTVDSGLELVTEITFPATAKKPKKAKEPIAEDNVNVPEGMTLGFSRISSLAKLDPENRHDVLQKYVLE